MLDGREETAIWCKLAMFLRERGLVTIIFIRRHLLEVRLNDLLAAG